MQQQMNETLTTRQKLELRLFQLSMEANALRFGEFKLKSGRLSPYFFNAGLLNTGSLLGELAKCYAGFIREIGIEFDVLFGPSYKGIPLACATTVALKEQYSVDVPYAFNRKEVKDHGEGGGIVGASLEGQRALIIDDVITAGTATKESVKIIKAYQGIPVGVVLALDRQERGMEGELSAVQECQRNHGFPVYSIATCAGLIPFLNTIPAESGDDIIGEYIAGIEKYRKQYGAEI